jgi:hypothetical protein
MVPVLYSLAVVHLYQEISIICDGGLLIQSISDAYASKDTSLFNLQQVACQGRLLFSFLILIIKIIT